MWSEEEEEEVQEPSSLSQQASPSQAIKVKKKKRTQTPKAFSFKETKECFTCEKTTPCSCRKTPEEIFKTRQTLWAKALQTEKELKEKTIQEGCLRHYGCVQKEHLTAEGEEGRPESQEEDPDQGLS